MCGIAGIYSKKDAIIDQGLLKLMCDAMRHRGPDDEGYFIDRNIGLSMRRLSIIDLFTGKQPIHNENKTIWIVFNGEIYNYKELRSALESNHHFYTNSDTEVIVHMYEEYGERFVDMLNGMFTFCIYDMEKCTAYIARDRLGIKPLYYTEDNEKLVFASEIKSILKIIYTRREVDLDALDCYFSFLYTPAPLTMFKGIKKLMPGHILKLRDGKIELNKYWDFKYKPQKHIKISSLKESFLEVFRNSIKRQLISDVPLGAFLSGGIDSSAVVAFMSEILQKPVETFSIGYGEKEAYYDEREDAKLVAGLFKTNHHEFELRPDIINIVPKVIETMDEPLADASAIPNYFLSQKTRNYVTVALSGLGGDELCGGYPRYVGMYLSNYYKNIPRIFREKMISNIVCRIPDSVKGKRFIDRAKRFVKFGDLPPEAAYFNMISSFDRDTKNSLFNTPLFIKKGKIAEEVFNKYFSHYQNELLMNRILFADMKLYLVDDLLTLTDKMSMANSLEVRVPFLDNEMLEFMATIPPELKIRRTTTKYLMKKSLEEILPDKILYKEKKGFSVPLTLWFRDDLKKFVRNYLSKDKIQTLNYFNWKYVEELLDDHFNRKENYYGRIWSLLVFCLWHDIYIQNGKIDNILEEIQSICSSHSIGKV